jgi:hypothetical protein
MTILPQAASLEINWKQTVTSTAKKKIGPERAALTGQFNQEALAAVGTEIRRYDSAPDVVAMCS